MGIHWIMDPEAKSYGTMKPGAMGAWGLMGCRGMGSWGHGAMGHEVELWDHGARSHGSIGAMRMAVRARRP